jgi:hypothetical protein
LVGGSKRTLGNINRRAPTVDATMNPKNPIHPATDNKFLLALASGEAALVKVGMVPPVSVPGIGWQPEKTMGVGYSAYLVLADPSDIDPFKD